MKLRFLVPIFLGFFLVHARGAFADSSTVSTQALTSIAQNLKLDDMSLKAVQVSDQTNSENDRDTHQIQLVHPEVGTIQLTLNGPKDFATSSSKFSVLFVTAGFTETTALQQALQDPNLIIATYSYPSTLEDFAKDSSLVSKTIRVIPGQIALALEWLKERKYIDADRFTAAGFELGALFLPVSLQLAELRGSQVSAIIFSKSDKSLNQALQKALSKVIQEPTLTMVNQLMSDITKTYEPKSFLPGLHGQILQLDENHISNENPEQIKKMAQKIQEFLSQSNLN